MLIRRKTLLAALLLFYLITLTMYYTVFHYTYSRAHDVEKYSVTNDIVSLTTIVTAYFPLDEKAKYSVKKYSEWLPNFFSYIENPMVIFTSQRYVSVLRSLRGKRQSSLTIFVTNFSSALEMPPVKKLYPFFQRNYLIDPERAYHSVDLYAVWCAKSFILNYTASLNPFHSNYFLYVDAGAFRDSNHRFRKWPDDRIMSQIFNAGERILLGMINPVPRRFCDGNFLSQNVPGEDENLIQGGIIAGTTISIRWWTHIYYEMCDFFVQNELFIGKDQNIMNTIALSNPTRIKVILSFRVSCGDVWFAFGAMLASSIENNVLFNDSCRTDNRIELIQPLEQICSNSHNLT